MKFHQEAKEDLAKATGPKNVWPALVLLVLVATLSNLDTIAGGPEILLGLCFHNTDHQPQQHLSH